MRQSKYSQEFKNSTVEFIINNKESESEELKRLRHENKILK